MSRIENPQRSRPKIFFLGDSHSDWNALNRIFYKHPVKNGDTLIHCGDCGLGFGTYDFLNQKTGLWETHVGKKDPEKFPDNFKFCAGNHDSPEACKKYPNYLGRFGFDEKLGIFFVSGGYSIDAGNRTLGIDWWDDEQLSYTEFQECLDLYEKVKPEIVVSHECPASINRIISDNPYQPSRTSVALQQMLEIWEPKSYFFGHWHCVWTKKIGRTQFTCCAINQVVPLSRGA